MRICQLESSLLLLLIAELISNSFLFLKDVMCEFTMDNYMVSEINSSVSVCVSLTGNAERSVAVTVFTLGSSAVGEYIYL